MTDSVSPVRPSFHSFKVEYKASFLPPLSVKSISFCIVAGLVFKYFVIVFAFISDSFEGHEIHKDCLPEFATTPNDEDLIERRNLPKFLTEHCHFTAPDIWMLTYAFRPRRKILFVYVRTENEIFFSG